MARRPLNPSIRFDPLIIKRKHKRTKRIENNSIDKIFCKKFNSIHSIFIENIFIKMNKTTAIVASLVLGVNLSLMSSKNPIKKRQKLSNKCSMYKIEKNKSNKSINIKKEIADANPPLLGIFKV